MSHFRLLPTTMMVALLFTTFKVIDVIRGSEALSLIASVQAEAGGKEPPKEASTKAVSTEKPKEEAKHGEGDAHVEPSAGGDGHGAASDGKEKEPSNVSDTPGETIDDHLSEVQIELLQKLADRRDELDRWEKDIQMKETVLAATEKRLNEKIAQIESMKSEVGTMLSLYNEKEDTKIRSLVKIYENMKPKDAARIFDEVEMPVLLLVIDKMAEKKVAPILANMDPKKAKQLTVELAEQRKVDEAKLNNITSAR